MVAHIEVIRPLRPDECPACRGRLEHRGIEVADAVTRARGGAGEEKMVLAIVKCRNCEFWRPKV